MAVNHTDPHLTGRTECYEIDPDATWYSPNSCHMLNHHEWLHAQSARDERMIAEAYDVAAMNRDLFVKTLGLLRELRDAAGEVPPELDARVRGFLNASDFHETMCTFMEGAP